MENQTIMINNNRYVVGRRYRVYSPLDSPYLFLNPTDKQTAKELQFKCRNNKDAKLWYTGRLIQIPYTASGMQVGNCLYFEVEGVQYHRQIYKQAEQMSMIAAGVVKVIEI